MFWLILARGDSRTVAAGDCLDIEIAPAAAAAAAGGRRPPTTLRDDGGNRQMSHAYPIVLPLRKVNPNTSLSGLQYPFTTIAFRPQKSDVRLIDFISAL